MGTATRPLKVWNDYIRKNKGNLNKYLEERGKADKVKKTTKNHILTIQAISFKTVISRLDSRKQGQSQTIGMDGPFERAIQSDETIPIAGKYARF